MNCRPEVEVFAELMEMKLKENDHKRGWGEDDLSFFLGRLMDELSEVIWSLKPDRSVPESDQFYSAYRLLRFSIFEMPGHLRFETVENREAVIGELVDVANFAMMIVDRLKEQT